MPYWANLNPIMVYQSFDMYHSRKRVQPSLEDKVVWVEEKKKGIYLSNPCSKYWNLPSLVIFQQTSYGSLRYSLEYVSLRGKQLGERPQHLTRFRREEDP